MYSHLLSHCDCACTHVCGGGGDGGGAGEGFDQIITTVIMGACCVYPVEPTALSDEQRRHNQTSICTEVKIVISLPYNS